MGKKELEQTLIIIKPDALINSLTGYVLMQFSEFHTGLRFAGTKIVHVSKMLAEEHYIGLMSKTFFPMLIKYFMGQLHYPNEHDKQRVVAFVYQGPNAVDVAREIAGPTDPLHARAVKPGCIRALGADFPCRDEEIKELGNQMDNLIHASATVREAEREVKLWFRPTDIPPHMHAFDTEECNEHFYYKSGKLFTTHQPGSTLLMAPGRVVWRSDFEALHLIHRGEQAHCSLEAVAAKYMMNDLNCQ